jgi:hypothetical protein
MLRIRRSRGAAGGVLVALLGVWGGLVPFIGPYFHYAYTPDKAWTYSTGRLWLEILPGGAALLGGLVMILARGRHIALGGAVLGMIAGAWFALGDVLAPLWTTPDPAGVPAGATTTLRVAEQIGLFTGLGIALVLVAASVAGRLTAVPGAHVRTERAAPPAAVEAAPPTVPVSAGAGE